MGGASRVSITPAAPFDFKQTLWFLDRNLDDCMHRVLEGGRVRRVLPGSSLPCLIEVSQREGQVRVQILKGDAPEKTLREFTKEWFDLDRDLNPFYKRLKGDPDLSFMTRKYKGFKIVGIPDLFECLLWCITGQQINLSFAYALKRRLVEKYGKRVTYENASYYAFPSPAIIADLKVSELRDMQYTGRKAEYMISVAKAFADGYLGAAQLQAQGDEEKMLSFLQSFRGIGPWSANYALMKSVRAMNRVPYGDAGLRQAFVRYKGVDPRTPGEYDALLAPFEGWRTYVVFYMWRSLREMA